jgi:NodT family efflux transporter outer membrane factor (OMF) lipoprotein
MSCFSTARLALATAALLALAGCAAPVAAPTASWKAPAGWSADAPLAAPTAQAAAPVSEAWWASAGSAELNALVEAALRANRDLHIAAARVLQARAGVEAADAQQLPQLGLAAGAQRGRDSSANPQATVVSGGLRAGWEPDLFGAQGLASQAATLDAQGAELAQQAMRVAIAADVGTAWFEIQALRRREAVARDALATLERQIEVARRRFDAGQSSALDVDRLLAERGQERAALAQLQGAQRARQRQLAVLTGAAQPDPALAFADTDAPGIAAPAGLLPAELLERRPDVQLQARALEAAAARLGVARRDLYPRIQLDWAGRKERLSVDGASASPTLVVGYGVSLALPIFDGGRIRANIAVHEARIQEAMAGYEKAMIGALADAETALVQLAAAETTVAELERAQRAAADAVSRSQRLYEAGLVGLDTVLDVRRSHLRAQDALLEARSAQWVAGVSVRRAFAGRV